MGIFLFRHDFLLFFKALHLTTTELKTEFRFKVNLNLSRWLTGKGSTCQAGDVASVRKIPGRRKCQPTPVFLPGKFHGQRSLVGYSSWGLKRTGQNLETKKQNLSKVSLYSIITKMLRMLTMKSKHESWQVNSTKN